MTIILIKSSKTKKYYLCGVPTSSFPYPPVGWYGGQGRLWRMKGEMAEWSNAAVLKTVVLLSWDRGFESLFLRQRHQISPVRQQSDGIFVLWKAWAMLAWVKVLNKTKTPQSGDWSDAFEASPRGITIRRQAESNPSLILPCLNEDCGKQIKTRRVY